MLVDHSVKRIKKNNNKTKQNKKETGDLRYIYQNQLDKACFEYDLAYGDFKDLPRWVASDKILHNKAFKALKNYGSQRGLASMVYKVFDEKSSGGGVKSEEARTLELELADELHKPLIRKFEKRKKTFIFYRQYLERWFSGYAIDK